MGINTDVIKRELPSISKLFNRYDDISSKLKDIAEEADYKSIIKLRENFEKKVDDFNREDRKLNIAVVGRVKAGKSTFLNTAVFDGKKVLPEAFTPKTATLTKIEYATENSVIVEYYSPDEWEKITAAAEDTMTEEGRAAKELISDAEQSGVDVSEYLRRGHDLLPFSSEQDLVGELNQYVGAHGKVTPLVKCVTLYMNKPELDGVSIVDTPGLNDPVMSRTTKTKEFLEKCDVVFFLSPADSFLDDSDVELLKRQLPQKGVVRIVLICSKFDVGIANVILDDDDYDIESAIQDLKLTLNEDAEDKFAKIVNEYNEKDMDYIAGLLANCKKPLYVSSAVHSMIGRAQTDYTEAEQKIFSNINEKNDVTDTVIAEIGDMSAVEQEFEIIIRDKEAALKEKGMKLEPLEEQRISGCINELLEKNKARLDKIKASDVAVLQKQRQEVGRHKHDIEAAIVQCFGSVYERIETGKGSILADLRASSKDYSTALLKTGTRTKTGTYEVSTSKWYNPFSWGSTETRRYTYKEHYTYIEVADVLERIRHYAMDVASAIESGFMDSVDCSRLKRDISKLILNSFDASSDDYDPGYFRLMIEEHLNKIEFPIIRLDVGQYIKKIGNEFSGQLEGKEQSEIQIRLSHAIGELYDEFIKRLASEIEKLKISLNLIKDGLSDNLLRDINAEFDKIETLCQDKEKSVEKIEKYIHVLESLHV